MTQELSEALGKVLYSEPSNYSIGDVPYRKVCRLHSFGWSATILRKQGTNWVTVNHSERVLANPLTDLMGGI